MRSRWLGLVIAAFVTAGCEGIPKDPEGTTERVRKEGVFNVGVVAPPGTIAPLKEAEFLKQVELASRAKPKLRYGPAEALLRDLEEGKLDLVMGEFSPKSPWSKSVHFLPPLGEKVTEEGHALLSVAVRNGENQWVAILQREAAAVAGGSK